jgi:hypothetical protein
MSKGTIYPAPVIETTLRVIEGLDDSGFFEDQECDKEITAEKFNEALTPKFLQGEDLELSPDEILKVLNMSIIMSSLRKLEKLNLVGSIDDGGVEKFFLTEFGRKNWKKFK